jgi:hypothetical protein
MKEKTKKSSNDGAVKPAINPEISKCSMTDCTFNSSGRCHAKFIEVGDDHQKCDTYAASSQKIKESASTGAVGTCKVSRCAYNKGSRCMAGAITVSRHDNNADCEMFNTASII